MARMHTHEMYPIGDAARRSGLSVSAVRFYADEGLVEPTGLNEAGHRLYDIDAVARLELVRTLRDLDTDLREIRRLLDGRTTLPDLLAAHLEIVERQERAQRAKRAVLRTLIRQGGATAQADLLHKLVAMTDEERARVIDDFWNEVGADLGVPDGFVDRLRAMRPVLPADPSAAQLEAWIELGDLVRDPAFRDAVRAYLGQTYTTEVGRNVAGEPFQAFVHESGVPLVEEVLAAYRAGVSARSTWARDAVTRFTEAAAELSDEPLTPELRDRMADGYERVPDLLRQIEEEDAASRDPVYDDTHGRYAALVAVINGTGPEEEAKDVDPAFYQWVADAMRAPDTGA